MHLYDLWIRRNSGLTSWDRALRLKFGARTVFSALLAVCLAACADASTTIKNQNPDWTDLQSWARAKPSENRKHYDSAYLAHLTKLRDAGEHKQAIDAFEAAHTSPQKAITVMDFARSSVLQGKAPALYAVHYAHFLWDLDVHDRAVTWWAFSMLRVSSDATRCADESLSFAPILLLEPLEPVARYFQNLPREEQRLFIRDALQLDADAPLRRHDDLYCPAGFRAFFSAPGASSDNGNGVAGNSPSTRDETALTPENSSETSPVFVDDVTWAERRRQIRAVFIEQWGL